MGSFLMDMKMCLCNSCRVYQNELNFILLKFSLAYTSWTGLGFVTSITFIFLVGVFMSSWLGASVLGLGEWFIKRMPFVRHIYNASKQISSAISPGVVCVHFLAHVLM